MVRALILKVVEKDGSVVEQREIDTDILNMYLERRKDLGTDWFGRILASAFAANHIAVTVTNEDGSTSTDSARLCLGCCRCHIWIGVGKGTTPPSRTDYKLESELDVKPAVSRYLDGSGVVVITAAFVFDRDVDVSEVGLFLCDGDINATSPGARTLLDRTVLDAPIHVSAQQSLYVEYRIAI